MRNPRKTILKKLEAQYDANPHIQVLRLSRKDLDSYRLIREGYGILSEPLTWRGIEVIENKGFIA